MPELTAHQREALDLYNWLRVRHPELFARRALCPIIEDRAVLESYAAEHGTVLEWRRRRRGFCL